MMKDLKVLVLKFHKSGKRIFELIHRQFRKPTKNKGAFLNENSILKLLYMGIQNASKNGTMSIRNFSLTISQLKIWFECRLYESLNLWLKK